MEYTHTRYDRINLIATPSAFGRQHGETVELSATDVREVGKETGFVFELRTVCRFRDGQECLTKIKNKNVFDNFNDIFLREDACTPVKREVVVYSVPIGIVGLKHVIIYLRMYT